jgi:formylglycine-generating enzyme
MVLVPAGRFEMGIDETDIPRFQKFFDVPTPRLFQDEIPKHNVTLHAFEIDRYLVTNAQFQAFVAARPDWRPTHLSSDLDNGNYLRHWKGGKAPASIANHPVVNVNWYAAAAYCQWAGGRLPTEAEWEYAARGGAHGPFSWGNQPIDGGRANYSGSGLRTTSPADRYPANGYGLHDMGGNVWQFLADEWKQYTAAVQENPVVGGDLFLTGRSFLQVRTRRVIRGGSFDGAPVNLWVEYRDSHPPNGSREFVGFRCAK